MGVLLAAMPPEFNIKEHPGYNGVFTTNEADGAYPNGTRIVKSRSEEGDATPTGTKGTVLGSIRQEPIPFPMYFVEWDNRPKFAVAVIGLKIQQEGTLQ